MEILKALELNNGHLTDFELVDVTEVRGNEHPLLNVYDKEISEVLGFGGAFTETSAYNYSLLSYDNKKKAIEALFGEGGLRYNLCRLCIASSDFCLSEYCCVEDNDFELKTFSIERDKKYIIPFIKDALRVNPNIEFLASPWSPPKWMKTNNDRLHGGKLEPECYELYAEYLCKFLESYKNEGINISYLTIQNEQKATQTWESCTFSFEEEISFGKVLQKALKKHRLNVKLLGWDHNKERLVERSVVLEEKNLFDGMAFHWYSGDHFEAVNLVRKMYPNSLLLETEFCKSNKEDSTIASYANEYVNVLRNGGQGLIEWNLFTDKNGGPFHDRKGGCLAPLTYLNDNNFELSSNYNQTFIFSHFIKKGAKSLFTSSYNEAVKISAVRNPNGEIVIDVVNNFKDEDMKLYIFGKLLKFHCMKTFSYVIVLKK